MGVCAGKDGSAYAITGMLTGEARKSKFLQLADGNLTSPLASSLSALVALSTGIGGWLLYSTARSLAGDGQLLRVAIADDNVDHKGPVMTLLPCFLQSNFFHVGLFSDRLFLPRTFLFHQERRNSKVQAAEIEANATARATMRCAFCITCRYVVDMFGHVADVVFSHGFSCVATAFSFRGYRKYRRFPTATKQKLCVRPVEIMLTDSLPCT